MTNNEAVLSVVDFLLCIAYTRGDQKGLGLTYFCSEEN